MSVRILLADDHTLMRQGLRHILESHADFDIVAEASSGIEAVEAARAHKPDVAIVDVGMKELNGIEATAADSEALAAHRRPDPEHVQRRALRAARGEGRGARATC